MSDTTNVFLVKPSLTYANQLLLPKERLKVIGYRDEDQDMKSWDVQLGYPFFKSLGEVMVLDFKEMKLKIWRKSDAIQLVTKVIKVFEWNLNKVINKEYEEI